MLVRLQLVRRRGRLFRRQSFCQEAGQEGEQLCSSRTLASVLQLPKAAPACVCLQPAASKLSPELSELVVYACSVPFKGLEQAAERPAAEMSSFSESKALRLIKDSGMAGAGTESGPTSRST